MAFDSSPVKLARRAAGAPCSRPRSGRAAMSPAMLALTAACVALGGCSSTPKQAYPETFKETNTYSRSYHASDAATCEAARRALLSQGYTIGKAQADSVEGQKNFQVRDDDNQHQVILFHVVCTSEQQASPNTTVFVNAVQDRYIIKKTSSSAGVGLSVLGSVSMPFGSYEDSLAKVSSETISAPDFYEGFFDLLQRYLPQSKAAPAAQQSNPAPATPAAQQGKPASDAPAAQQGKPASDTATTQQGTPPSAPPAGSQGQPAAGAPATQQSKPADSGQGGANATP